MIIWVFATIVILITLGLLYLFIPTIGITAVENYGPYVLGTQDAKIGSDTVKPFLEKVNSSFRVFYYVKSIPRTSTAYSYSEGVAPNFNSKTNSFDICTNTNGECIHQGFVPLLKFGNSIYIELLQAPDASRPGLPKTQLCIQTTQNTGSTNTVYLETFSLPPFPMQKWTMLSIVRRGNTFDIYYNNTLVASHRTTYSPYFVLTEATLSDGGIRGEAKYVKTTDKALLSQEINAEYAQLTDTRGEPISPMFGPLNISLCPSGECFRGPQIRPANPLVDWQTNYM